MYGEGNWDTSVNLYDMDLEWVQDTFVDLESSWDRFDIELGFEIHDVIGTRLIKMWDGTFKNAWRNR